MKHFLLTGAICLFTSTSLHAQEPLLQITTNDIIKGGALLSVSWTGEKQPIIAISRGNVAASNIRVYEKGKPQELLTAESNAGVLTYDAAKRFEGERKTVTLVLEVKDNRGPHKQEIIIADARTAGGEKSGKGDAPKETKNLLKLFKEEKDYANAPSIALSELLTNLGDCCCEDIVPCTVDDCDKHDHKGLETCCSGWNDPPIEGTEQDLKRFHRNRIIYSVYPQYAYTYMQNGSIKKQRPLRITAGHSVTLEIRNFNRDLFTVAATPRSESYNTDPPGLLSLLTSPDITKATGTDGTEQTQLSGREKAKVAAVLTLEQISQFLNVLDNSGCLNISNQYARYKALAKRQVDAYFGHFFHAGGMPINALSYLAAALDIEGADSALYRTYKKAYERLESRQFRYVINLPSVEGHVDKIIYNLDIKNIKDGLPYIVPKQDLSVYTVGGFKVDFSSGIYYAGFRDSRLSIRKDSTILKGYQGNDSAVVNRRGTIVDEGERVGEFGFSSFVHFYPKLSPAFSIGGALGAGLTFSEGSGKAAVRYFAGVSALVGLENRIAVTAGYAAGFVNKVSKQYTVTNGVFDPVPFNATDVSYVRKFQARGFVSVTYNLPIGAGKDTKTVKATDAAATK